MNNALRRSGIVFTLVVCFASMLLAGGTTITILHVNDSHAHLDAFGPKDFTLHGMDGGIAKAATVIGLVRKTEPNVLLLHAGDISHGDLFYNFQPSGPGGAPEMEVPELLLMKQLGFDAMALGNHELEFGPDALLGALSSAIPPGVPFVLSANADLSNYPGLENWIRPSMSKTIGGVNIGIFGMTVPDPSEQLEGQGGSVAIDTAIASIAANTVAKLKAKNADLVICLSHLGFLRDQEIAALVPDIDIIVGGHDHYLFAEPKSVPHANGRKTLILQAGEFYKYVGKLTLWVENKKVTVKGYQIIPVDWRVPPFPQVQGVVDDIKKGIVARYGDMYHKVVGIAVRDLDKLYDPNSPLRDTPLGDLVTDACRRRGGTDIAIAATGFISEKIFAGPIVGADIFRAMSYGFDPATGLGFKLVKMNLMGSDLITGLEATLSYLGLDDDYFLQVSGMKFNIDGTKPVGQRVILSSIRIGTKPLNPSAIYSCTVNEGIIALLPLLGIGPVTEPEVMSTDFEYHVVRDYIKSLGVVCYLPQGRIRDISVRCRPGKDVADDEVVAQNATQAAPETVDEYELAQNYPNPFNPSTTISYSLPAIGHVTLKIFNTLGQEVATLLDDDQPAGRHQTTWNATNVSSGVYFYRLTAGNFAATKKLTLMK